MRLAALIASLTLSPAFAQDSGGPLGIDHYRPRSDTGLLSRPNQKRLDAVLIAGTLGTALWEGTDSRTGRLGWQSLDAMLTTMATTEVLKNTFSRTRPAQNPDPNVWFAGSGHKSFPSGETAMVAAFVTPWILELHEEHPAAWGLAALPLYMGAARMASQGHWLSDVLVGAGIGAVMGHHAHQRTQPLVLTLTGDGVFVGWKAKF
ncbi:phosphatase PAP2 family protein [Sphaerotilus sp.]|jgi:membrane-associated phospholipid phosphatase|uniref:phosphatase PAP2 family protein n=1 Tax=Sphaerotilus sp. TaxID=2093942 RepID=UPI0025F57248|nr:phosphatase PAP2 family protein [Sphaerotilus sp.]